MTSLLVDRAGTLWAGTHGSGLCRLPSDRPGASVLTADQGLLHNSVNDLCEDREGNLWVATQMGLQVLRDVRFVNFGRPAGLARWREEGRLDLFPAREDLDGSAARALCVDAAGDRWVGGNAGLFHLRGTEVLARHTAARGQRGSRARAPRAPRPRRRAGRRNAPTAPKASSSPASPTSYTPPSTPSSASANSCN